MSGLTLIVRRMKKGEPDEGKWVVALNNGGKDVDDTMQIMAYFESIKDIVQFFGEFALDLGQKYVTQNWAEEEND